MKAIVLHFIREGIKQTRFIQQLNNLGLSADEHLLNLSPVIFDLMELDRSTPEKVDVVQEGYREFLSMNPTINSLNIAEIFTKLTFE